MNPEKIKTLDAHSIGETLKRNANFLNKNLIETEYGPLTPISGLKVNSNLSESYQNKKTIFWLGKSAVVIHYWGEEYVGDSLYFRRLYQNSKEVYKNKLIPTPQLLSFDDKTMTLIIERAKNDLSVYLPSENEDEIKLTLNKVFNLFHHLWQNSKEKTMDFPRYVSSFLKPEYPFLKSKQIDDYVPSDLNKLYRETQQQLTGYLNQIKKQEFESGFSLADIKLDNLVENKKENVLFIDVEKPGKAHWLTLVGQIYQDVVHKKPDSFFMTVLEGKCQETIEKETNHDVAERHFNLGRMNRILLPYTLRNISYNVETNNPIDFKQLENSLNKTQSLLQK